MKSETLEVAQQKTPTSIEVLGQHACIDIIQNLKLATTAPVYMIKQEVLNANKILEDMGPIEDPIE